MNEVKRQAMDEVQKAVAEAEQKAFEMIAAERAKMEKTLAEAKRKAQEDAILVINEQEDSSEVRRRSRAACFLKDTRHCFIFQEEQMNHRCLIKAKGCL